MLREPNMRVTLFLLLLSIVSAESLCDDKRDPWDLCNDPGRTCHLVADPTDCAIFYSCVEQGRGHFIPYKERCQDGLGFNEIYGGCGACDRVANVPRCSCNLGSLVGDASDQPVNLGMYACYVIRVK